MSTKTTISQSPVTSNHLPFSEGHTPEQIAAAVADGAKLIELSFGKFAIVDAEDFERLSIYKWCSVTMCQTWYAKTLHPNGGHLSMHRVITNAPKHLIVDHIDNNGLNNRRSNLRLCTHQQNMFNRRPWQCGTSRHKGVHWDKESNKYRAIICHNSKQYRLGRFENEDDAGRAYDKAAKKYFGEFAYLNFPAENSEVQRSKVAKVQSGKNSAVKKILK